MVLLNGGESRLSEARVGCAQGRTAGESQSCGRAFPSMPASLLSCLWASGCPVCACWGWRGAVFQNALTAEQSPPVPVSGPCVSHPAQRTGWLASRTEPAQVTQMHPSRGSHPPSLAPAQRYQPGDHSSWWPWEERPWGAGSRAGGSRSGQPLSAGTTGTILL